ncbi:cell surface glycoprotein 1-like isoform X4 [Bolinopsis microptera]|uniref:cell surface glycoprotein 1-like isoform X4 n=1 Tax=Bolinopsis microptera TaxID=2820187 RepID=UPI0030792B06
MAFRSNTASKIAYPQHGETFEEWATLSHLKDSTLEVLRSNEIDDLSTVRLLNADDIKKLPIKLGQAKLLEYAVKKLKRSDASLNTSKETSYSRGSSPDRSKSDSFYIVPSPHKGRKSPTKFSQVEVDDITPEDPENSPCTIRITIETKKDEDMDPEETSYIEEIVNPSRNLFQELDEPTIMEESEDHLPTFYVEEPVEEHPDEEGSPKYTSDTDAEHGEPATDDDEDDGLGIGVHSLRDEGSRQSPVSFAEVENEDLETVEDAENPEKEDRTEDIKDGEHSASAGEIEEGEEPNDGDDEGEAEEVEEEKGELEEEDGGGKEEPEPSEEDDKPDEPEEPDEGNEEENTPGDEEKKDEEEEVEEEKEDEVEDNPPAGEMDETVTDLDLEVKGEALLPPPPPPIEVPSEVSRMTLEIEANAADLETQVLISSDRQSLFIPCMESLANRREELIKHAARRIVAESMSDNTGNDDEHTRDKLVAFLEGAYGTTLIRLSNDQGTLKFLVPQLSETAMQTEEDKEEEVAAEEEAAEEEAAEEEKEDDAGADNKDLDSISGELSTPLCEDSDLPPPAECDEERDRMPDPPQIEEPGDVQKPVDRKESIAYDPEDSPNAISNFHTPKAVNKHGNYTQVPVMLGEDLQAHPTTRRPMSPVVSQPIRWECNRSQKGSSPPRITKGGSNKNTSPVRHRTPSPQRFKSPDRGPRVRVSNGLPAGTAYKHSGEIDPKIKESPPKDIVNKIRNTIESPSRVKSPPKPRSPSPVKPFDTDAFRLARKLAQEVADCPPDCIMVRVKDLQRCPKALLPPELDKARLEEYISDTEFRRTLGLSRGEYDTFSEWKQQEIKKELGLF